MDTSLEATVNIVDYIWIPDIVDKLHWKHSVEKWEVIEVLEAAPYIRFSEKGAYPNEDVYAAYGQTDSGRYLVVFFVYKRDKRALILSARNMTPRERRLYERR